MFKPMFEDEKYKPVDRKRMVPTHNREHPKNLQVRHEGRGLGGVPIVVQIKSQRKSLCGLRDAMAKSGSSAKRGHILRTNERLDERLSAPPAPFVEAATAKCSPEHMRSKGVYRKLASRLV